MEYRREIAQRPGKNIFFLFMRHSPTTHKAVFRSSLGVVQRHSSLRCPPWSDPAGHHTMPWV
jgi:hypothetical protein